MILKFFFICFSFVLTMQLQGMDMPTDTLETELGKELENTQEPSTAQQPQLIFYQEHPPKNEFLVTIQPTEPKATFDSLLNVPSIIQSLARSIRRENRNEHNSNMLLLYGPPGNGKSTYAEALAHATGRIFYHINSSIFGNIYKGAAAQIMRDIFQQINTNGRPCLVLLDELDGIVDKDINGANNEFKQALFALFEQIDRKDPNIFIVMTTNNKSALPGTILSRCNYTAQIINPDQDMQIQLLTRYIQIFFNYNEFPANKIHSLARETDGLSIRDLNNLTIRASELSDIPQTDDQNVKNNAIEVALYDALFSIRGITEHTRAKFIKHYIRLKQPEAIDLTQEFLENLVLLTTPYHTKEDYVSLVDTAILLAKLREQNTIINEQDLLTAYYMTNRYVHIEQRPFIEESEDGIKYHLPILVNLNHLPNFEHRVKIFNSCFGNNIIQEEATARIATRTEYLSGYQIAMIVSEAHNLRRACNANYTEEKYFWVAFHNYIVNLPLYVKKESYFREPVFRPYEKIKIHKKLITPTERLALLQYYTRHKQLQLSENFLTNFANKLPIIRRKNIIEKLIQETSRIAQSQQRIALQDQDFESAAYNIGLFSRRWCNML